jgi:hypothetical protein
LRHGEVPGTLRSGGNIEVVMEIKEATPALARPPGTRLVVYTITEKPGSEKSFWSKIGNAWINRDLSINIQLDALPVNGKLHLREHPERVVEPTAVGLRPPGTLL